MRRPASISRATAAVHVVADLVEKAGRVLDHTQKHASGSQQPGGHRALDRFGRSRVGEPRGEDGRRQAVVRERDEDGVEEARLFR